MVSFSPSSFSAVPGDPAGVDVGKRNRVQEPAGIGVAGRCEDRRAIALLHRPAVQHHHDPVAHGADDRQVVTYEQERKAEVAAQLPQQRQDLGLARHVEAGDDLVGDDQSGLQGDGPRDADALALTARQLVGIPLAVGGPQRDAFEQRVDLAPRLVSRCRAAMEAQRLGDDVGHPPARVERGLRVLEDHLELRAQRAQPVFRQVGDVAPVEQQAARGRPVEPDQGAPQAGLAGAALADDAERVAGREREVDAVQNVDRRGRAEGRLTAVIRQGKVQPGPLPGGRAQPWLPRAAS